MSNELQRLALPLFHTRLGDAGSWVIVLHGLFGAGANLGYLAKQLAQAHQVVLVDLRNHGQSPQSAQMSLALLAQDIAALQDHLGIDSAALVGHSLGGKVAMQLALGNAERVQRLAVLDIAPVNYEPHHQAIFAGLQAVDLSRVQNRRDADVQLTAFIPELSVRQFLLKSLVPGEQGYRWLFNLPALLGNYPALCAAPRGNPWPGPALFLKGELSDYIQAKDQAALALSFPHYELLTIEQASHWLHAEQPATVNAAIVKFLREMGTSG